MTDLELKRPANALQMPRLAGRIVFHPPNSLAYGPGKLENMGMGG